MPADELCDRCGLTLEDVLAAPWVKEREGTIITVMSTLARQPVDRFAQWLTAQPWYEEAVRSGRLPKKQRAGG